MAEKRDQSSEFRDLWANFSHSGNQVEYCQGWLSLQCARISHATQGVLVLRIDENDSDSLSPVARWPADKEILQPLIELAERVIQEECGLVSELEDGAGNDPSSTARYEVAYPLKIDNKLMGVVSVAVGTTVQQELAEAMEQLQWGIPWIELMIRRHQKSVLNSELPKLKSAVEIVTSVLAEKQYDSACITFVTEMAALLECERVSLSDMHHKRLRIKAISHSSQFGKNMNLVRSLETAMEEAVFQRTDIRLPDSEQSSLVIRDHLELAEKHGCGTIYTLPLFSDESYFGALTFERSVEHPFTDIELDKARAISALCGEAIKDKYLLDRPLYTRAAEKLVEQLKRLFGPGYLGRKLVLTNVLLVTVFFSVVSDTYRVAADTYLEGSVRQVVIAPFDGYIDTALVRAGDVVEKDQVLSHLDDRDLRLERLNWASDRAKLKRQYEEAQAKHERGLVKVLAAQLEQNVAKMELVESKLQRTVLRSPFNGLVVSGDLTQRLGGAVQQGEVLFEVAPLDAYRIIMWVDEHQIADIKEGQLGHLVLKALPDESFNFTITRITPITRARDGGNYFRVESLLKNSNSRLRPGMEGVGKIEVSEQKLITILTREMFRWFKLKLWAWSP